MKRLLCTALLLLCASAAWAGRCATEVPLLSSPPVIDGDLSDPAWQQAAVVRGFVAAGRADPEVASPLTTMRLCYTKAALYLAFECAEPHLDRLVAARPERDYPMNKADSISLYFDLDEQWSGRRYIEIGCDCAGLQHDSYARDHSWDGAWTCRAGRTPDAWTLEFRIPFADVRYALAGGDVWWLSVERNRLAGGGQAVQSWCPAPGAVRSAEAAGRLVFGSYADSARVAAQRLAARMDEEIPLLRREAAATEQGAKALAEIEAIRSQVAAWASPSGQAPATAEAWQARYGEIEQARKRFESLYWTVRFAALLDA